jgi:hypothetical protein
MSRSHLSKQSQSKAAVRSNNNADNENPLISVGAEGGT